MALVPGSVSTPLPEDTEFAGLEGDDGFIQAGTIVGHYLTLRVGYSPELPLGTSYSANQQITDGAAVSLAFASGKTITFRNRYDTTTIQVG